MIYLCILSYLLSETITTSTIATVEKGDAHGDQNPNVQIVTPYKVSSPLVDPEDILYDQIHNVTTGKNIYLPRKN